MRMPHVKLLAVLYALLAAPSLFAEGAGEEWQALIAEVAQLSGPEDFEQATAVAKQALKLAEESVGPDHPDVATSLDCLANLYQTHGQFGEAEALYSRAGDQRESVWAGSSHCGR